MGCRQAELIGNFQDWMTSTDEKVTTTHYAIYSYFVWESIRQKSPKYIYFSFSNIKKAIGLSKKSKFFDILIDLKSWGFIQYKLGVNQHDQSFLKLINLINAPKINGKSSLKSTQINKSGGSYGYQQNNKSGGSHRYRQNKSAGSYGYQQNNLSSDESISYDINTNIKTEDMEFKKKRSKRKKQACACARTREREKKNNLNKNKTIPVPSADAETTKKIKKKNRDMTSSVSTETVSAKPLFQTKESLCGIVLTQEEYESCCEFNLPEDYPTIPRERVEKVLKKLRKQYNHYIELDEPTQEEDDTCDKIYEQLKRYREILELYEEIERQVANAEDFLRGKKIRQNYGFTPKELAAAASTVPPTIDMLCAYNIGRHNAIDEGKFIDYYNSKGWKVSGGKSVMKNWQSSVRLWEKNKMKQLLKYKDLYIEDDYGRYKLHPNGMYYHVTSGEVYIP